MRSVYTSFQKKKPKKYTENILSDLYPKTDKIFICKVLLFEQTCNFLNPSL